MTIQTPRNQVAARRVLPENNSEKGGAVLEFLLSAAFLLVPLLLGTTYFGMSLIRANQVTEVCRDAAHMYSSQVVDFSQTANKNILFQLAQGLNFTSNGVVILSTVTYIAAGDCTAAGLSADSGSCPNLGQTVFTNRIIVGNQTVSPSAFGTPNPSIVATNGNISTNSQLTDSSDRAVGFSNLISVSSGQYAYMAETFVNSPDFNMWKYIGSGNITSRSIF